MCCTKLRFGFNFLDESASICLTIMLSNLIKTEFATTKSVCAQPVKKRGTRQNKLYRQNLIFITFLVERVLKCSSHILCNTFKRQNSFHHRFILFDCHGKAVHNFRVFFFNAEIFERENITRVGLKQHFRRSRKLSILYQNAYSFACFVVTQKDVYMHIQSTRILWFLL